MPENVSGTTPFIPEILCQSQPVAAGVDLVTPAAVARIAGAVTSVTYTPRTTLTGANTESRTLTVVNETQAKTAATLAFVSGVNATAVTPKVIPVSGTAANVAVAVGDVITVKSTHVGATGLADPGGLFAIQITRA